MTKLPEGVIASAGLAALTQQSVKAENEIDVLAETLEDESVDPLGPVFEIHADPFVTGRRFGRGARLAAAMAMLGGMPSGNFPSGPTVHDTLSANIHDHKGALDRAKVKRERKLQRNLHNGKGE
jgi:hypothetical protein